MAPQSYAALRGVFANQDDPQTSTRTVDPDNWPDYISSCEAAIGRSEDQDGLPGRQRTSREAYSGWTMD